MNKIPVKLVNSIVDWHNSTPIDNAIARSLFIRFHVTIHAFPFPFALNISSGREKIAAESTSVDTRGIFLRLGQIIYFCSGNFMLRAISSEIERTRSEMSSCSS